MTDESGGYYSAEDAGEVGKEGEYYVWTEAELQQVLSAPELDEIKRIYGVTSLGNFEDGYNILNLQPNTAWSEKYEGYARAAFEKMQARRALRVSPHRDEKDFDVLEWVDDLCDGEGLPGNRRPGVFALGASKC